MKPDLKEKFIASILGVAIGDALGTPVEGLSPAEIRDRYGIISEYVINEDVNLEKGEYSDDTAMTLCILEALIENGFFDIHSIVEKFLKWFNDNPKGIGNTTYHALYLIDKGYSYDEASKMAYTTLSAGNGASMRVAPIPLFDYKKGMETIVQDTVDTSIITHYHPEAIAGAVATSLVIYHNLQIGDKDKIISFLLNECKEFIKNERILNAIEAVDKITESEVLNDGYIVETVKASLWFFLNTDNFTDAVIKSVNKGGDADTIAAIVGAFAGSYYGIKDIPEKFIRELQNSKYIIELSEKLYEISILEKIIF